jgi:hypothetical protein
MTQPLLDYQTPQHDRLGDAEPRWLWKLFVAVILMGGGVAFSLFLSLVPINSLQELHILPVAMACVSVWLLTARPPLPVSAPGLRGALRTIAAVLFPMGVVLPFLFRFMILRNGALAPSSSTWISIYSIFALCFFGIGAVQVALVYHYLSRLLRLVPAPLLAPHAIVLGSVLCLTALIYLSFFMFTQWLRSAGITPQQFLQVYRFVRIGESLWVLVFLFLVAAQFWRLAQRRGN